MSQLAIEYEKLVARGAKSVITQDFMEKLSYEMFLNSYRFSKEYNYEEYPLRQKERSIYSSLAASVDRITPVHLSEMPASRLKELKGSEVVNGRIDHWAYYRDTDFLIELKRCSLGLYIKTKQKLPQKVREPWVSLNNQLAKLSQEVKSWSGVPVCAGMLVVFFYTGDKKRYKSWQKIETDALVSKIIKKLEKVSKDEQIIAPGFYSAWHLPEKMRLQEYDDNTIEYTPAILIVGSFIVHDTQGDDG